jgi:hypothetical protein
MMDNRTSPARGIKVHLPGVTPKVEPTLLHAWGAAKDPEKKGSCTMSNIALFLYSDGTFAFQSFVSSDNEGDVWLVQNMTFFEGTSQIGETLPQFDSPRTPAHAAPVLFLFRTLLPGVTPELAAKIDNITWDNHC